MSDVNPDGSIKLTDKGESTRDTATLDGRTYVTQGVRYLFIPFGVPDAFVVQAQSSGGGRNAFYVLARRTGDGLARCGSESGNPGKR
jgi:hypothetical protein